MQLITIANYHNNIAVAHVMKLSGFFPICCTAGDKKPGRSLLLLEQFWKGLLF